MFRGSALCVYFCITDDQHTAGACIANSPVPRAAVGRVGTDVEQKAGDRANSQRGPSIENTVSHEGVMKIKNNRRSF